ncbi:unnamed protein product, partial [Staurois parvus]
MGRFIIIGTETQPMDILTRGGLTTRGPRAVGDHGASVSLPKLKKSYEKGTRGISQGPLLTPGPWAVPEFPNGQSAPDL